MLTFLKLGHKGNLGNQLFQIASTIGLAKRYNHKFIFPQWQYSRYFDFDFNEQVLDIDDWQTIKERNFNYHEWNIPDGNYSIDGWLQSELYFENIDVKKVFKFNEEFERGFLEKYHELFEKPTILITVRRGDFVDNEHFFQLSYKYYFTALLSHFSDFKKYNIVFTSDDIIYCKQHFSFIQNAFFLEKLNAIEQMCLASKFDHYIISNSTFSWWLARLGEKEGSKIICPVKNFAGPFAKQYDEKDYYPSRWIRHDERCHDIPNDYYRLILFGELYKYHHMIRNYFKKKWVIFKKRIKKLLRNNG